MLVRTNHKFPREGAKIFEIGSEINSRINFLGEDAPRSPYST